jgi:aldose 1-epimerase
MTLRPRLSVHVERKARKGRKGYLGAATHSRRVFFAFFAIFAFHRPAAAQYAVRRTPDLVQLEDTARQIVVAIAPSAGNLTREMTVKGHNILGPQGIPFLAPWANRLDEQAFYANGTKYGFDMTLGNVRGAIPSHGFLTTTDAWRVIEVKADDSSAHVTSRLEFFRNPMWLKQWPFAHTIEVTYTLQAGVLDVKTTITNMSADPMPVAIGFHPYFRLTDSPRDDWTMSVGARTHWLLASTKIPTGETEPIERFFEKPSAVSLRDANLDDVFGDLARDARGRATMSVAGKSQRLDVEFGPNYRAAVIWAPPRREFICFEPMAGITDALNLAQKNLYRELQSIAPGSAWTESFWVRPSGF